MKSTSAEAAAALFDLPPLPDTSEQDAEAAKAAAAEEAALAAELAMALESGDFADDAPDSRTDRRVDASWPARMRLPDGRVVQLRTRNISQGGVGLVSAEPIPAYTLVAFEMDAPPLDGAGAATLVKGTIRTTYTVDQGAGILCGATWQAPPAGLDVVARWVERLWR